MSSVLELESTPEIQDLRKKVGDFLTEFIYPNEKILDRYDDNSRKNDALTLGSPVRFDTRSPRQRRTQGRRSRGSPPRPRFHPDV